MSTTADALTARIQASPQVSPEQMAAAEAEFRRRYPAYATTVRLDELRARDYSRLDDLGHVYLDYTGGGLYAESQLQQHMDLLRSHVFGNPHSQNPTSQAMTDLVEHARTYVLEFFGASPDEYEVVFTPNASGALKLLGESYPFTGQGHYALAVDNHNSVNGIREFARTQGARITYLPLDRSTMRLDPEALAAVLKAKPAAAPGLFAYPAQSNFTGVQHPLDLIAEVQAQGWDVLLDAAAFAPTNRLDLSRWHPDYVSLSFYKIFGYPTGAGCLLARKPALAKLRRPWFAGGTIAIASVQGGGRHLLNPGAAAFEDGTVDYLSLPAVETGLRHIAAVGIDVVHTRVECLTGRLLEELTALRHETGQPLVRIYGPKDVDRRGGTLAFNLLDRQGIPFHFRRVEALANEVMISLRTGCFCNPGAGETAHTVTLDEMKQVFGSRQVATFDQFFAYMVDHYHKYPGTVRASVGLVTNFADVYRFVQFVRSFLDLDAAQIGTAAQSAPLRDTA